MATKLNYRRSGVTYQINLYDYQVDDWDATLNLFNTTEKFCPASTNLGHADASHMRIRDGGVTYAVLTEKTDPGQYVWGSLASGQGGRQDKQNRSAPTQMNTGAVWQSIGAGRSYSVYVKDNGTIWSTGSNSWGVLGHGSSLSTDSKSSPTQIGALSNWSKVNCGNNHVMALKTNGTLWTWGANSDGPLGRGDYIYRSSPVQVGGLTTWSKISAGYNHSAAIKTDGTLWMWGRASSGQLGFGNVSIKTSPVQLGANTWSAVEAGTFTTTAIRSDGTLWAWGSGQYGRLGDGTTIDKSSPIQIGSLTTWSKISASWHVLAIRTDGRLFSWGDNGSGELMQGDSGSTKRRSSPTQVGSATNWTAVAAGDGVSLVMNTSNILYGAGWGYYGLPGVGDRINHSTPTYAGSFPGWSLLTAEPFYGSSGHCHIEIA